MESHVSSCCCKEGDLSQFFAFVHILEPSKDLIWSAFHCISTVPKVSKHTLRLRCPWRHVDSWAFALGVFCVGIPDALLFPRA